MNKWRWILLTVIAAAAVAFFWFDLGRFLTLEHLEQELADLRALVAANPLRAGSTLFLVYIAVTGLSLPGAAILTLAAGAVFGLLWGTVLVSFASTIGATLAFLASRFLFRDWVQSRFQQRLIAINRGIEREGGFYLFTLRLIPIFPFFVINLVMGITPMRTWPFYWVSQLGMLAGTVVYVNAGRELARLGEGSGILNPGLILSFCLLGIFPLLAKRVVETLRRRRVLRHYRRPLSFDRNLIVIGAGSAGLVAAYIAAAVKASVSLIERHRMGGDCLNTGCVPSKALIRTARFLADVKRSQSLGIRSASVEFEFVDIMARVRRVIDTIEPHDSVERYTQLGVDCIENEARICSPWEVEVGGRTLSARNIIIATGGRPLVPPIPGLAACDYLTSDSVWELEQLPERLVVLGGGPIGCELAQCFARFGSKVTVVDMLERLLPREDADVADYVARRFAAEGIGLQLGWRAERVAGDTLVCARANETLEISFDRLLVAVGRRPITDGLGLEEIGVALTPQGAVEVDDYLRTSIAPIFACGDVVGPYQFTHVAAHQAWYAAVNALFGRFRRFRVDYSVIPWCTFTDPELARVGLNETEATEQDIDYEITRYGIDDLDRAIADEAADGLVKVLSVPGKDRILGATIVGEHAGDLLSEFVLAMRHGIGLNKILGTIHIYPTLAEANKYLAGNWKKAHAPERVLRWLERYHAWQRT
jgi:pyruvate/2-oxoglutarate dehydrogenase complex dihydrolipoamide dehydrogenase (E3) component/uncharacterized membrane protein YdjX (TVP38/TMEM64 family)